MGKILMLFIEAGEGDGSDGCAEETWTLGAAFFSKLESAKEIIYFLGGIFHEKNVSSRNHLGIGHWRGKHDVRGGESVQRRSGGSLVL